MTIPEKSNSPFETVGGIEPVITIKRTGCNGPCPVYSAKIYRDGTVVYFGEWFVKVEGERVLKISLERLDQLIRAFEGARYFSFRRRYDANVTCLPTTTTSLKLEGRRKKIVENECAGPDELEELEDKIDELAGLTELIGERD